MKILRTELEGVLEVHPARHADDRGWFSEAWSRRRWADAGFEHDWVQDNESVSVPASTVRGIHFQTEPHAQDKLVRVVVGRVLDVAVDLRRSSESFGRSVAIELSASSGNQLLIPKGFGHGFVTLEPNCHVCYKVTHNYSPEADAAINWLDPELAVDWGIDPGQAVVSKKDSAAPMLANADHLLFP